MDVFERAIIFAVTAHEGQARKNSGVYITHPMETAAIASTMTSDREILAAAVLHDTVEDAGVSLDTLSELFGSRVAALVASETEDKRAPLPPEQTWRIRKEESLRVLQSTDDAGVKILWLSDKLSNMRSFFREHLKQGDGLWQLFNQSDPAQQHWYYASVRDALADLRDFPAWSEYDRLIRAVFENK